MLPWADLEGCEFDSWSFLLRLITTVARM